MGGSTASHARGLGADLVDVDFSPFFETAKLLYDGPWVAERYAALGTELESWPQDILPVTRDVIEKASASRRSTLSTAIQALGPEAAEQEIARPGSTP